MIIKTLESKGGQLPREYQIKCIEDALAFLDSSDQKGVIEMPTGSGKTKVAQEIIDTYISSKPNARIIVLAPKKIICDQLYEELSALQAFGVTMGKRYGQTNDPLSNNLTVSTYRTFNGLSPKQKDDFDLIIADESHHALSPNTQQSLAGLSPLVKVIGLSATPSFRPDRKASDVFESTIHQLSLREAIENGYIHDIEAFVYTTGLEIETSSYRKDFTKEDLSTIASLAARNNTAVEFAELLAADNRQGIINCIPGNNNAHARQLAEQLSQKMVKSNEEESRRPLMAKAVGGHLSDEENTDILNNFAEGKIDILTFTNLLTEGWSSNNVRFIINLRPTTSEKNIKQLIGRGSRPGEDTRPTMVVDVIDEYSATNKKCYTALHALEATEKKADAPAVSAERANNYSDNEESPEEKYQRKLDGFHELAKQLGKYSLIASTVELDEYYSKNLADKPKKQKEITLNQEQIDTIEKHKEFFDQMSAEEILHFLITSKHRNRGNSASFFFFNIIIDKKYHLKLALKGLVPNKETIIDKFGSVDDYINWCFAYDSWHRELAIKFLAHTSKYLNQFQEDHNLNDIEFATDKVYREAGWASIPHLPDKEESHAQAELCAKELDLPSFLKYGPQKIEEINNRNKD